MSGQISVRFRRRFSVRLVVCSMLASSLAFINAPANIASAAPPTPPVDAPATRVGPVVPVETLTPIGTAGRQVDPGVANAVQANTTAVVDQPVDAKLASTG
jgi:hypothetical protein